MSEINTTPIVLLTHAANDLMVLKSASVQLPHDFPEVKGVNLQLLESETQMTELLAEDLALARIVILRVLGRLGSIPCFSQLMNHVNEQECYLIVVSGTGEPDPELTAVSTVPPDVLQQVLSYFQAGGSVNLTQLLCYLSDHLLLSGFGYKTAVALPEHGIYHPDLSQDADIEDWLEQHQSERPSVGIIFYRSHWMSGNTRFIDVLVDALEQQGMNALPVFTSSLRIGGNGTTHKSTALSYFCKYQNGSEMYVDVLINTTSFAMGEITSDGTTLANWSVSMLEQLNVPVLQAITSGMLLGQWQQSTRGLNPLDATMNVMLPEFDGRIISVPMSFKAKLGSANELVEYEPLANRVTRVAGLAARFAELKHKPNGEKKVAFIFTNSNSKASQIGNAVGLDAPASLLNILQAMRDQGYQIEPIPESGTALIHQLIDRCSYDTTYLSTEQLKQAVGHVSTTQYLAWFAELPLEVQEKMNAQWGEPPGEAYLHDNQLAMAGIELGNALVVLQPPRGYGMDPDAIYHQPDLPPTHHYYALYRWLRDQWCADAIVHVGKHGTLEWLPGKGVGVSEACFPDILLADLPLFYPFIINDPGEGAQAKRRTHATVVDHLTPPMTTADTYGELAQLTQLVDEYYQMEVLDPSKLPLLQQQIWELVKQTNLDKDLQFKLLHHDHDHDHDHGHHHAHEHHNDDQELPAQLTDMGGAEVAHLIEDLDGYLCELGAAQIRDGLHTLGQSPASEQLTDMLVSLTRLPNQDVPSLQEEIARLHGLNFDLLLEQKGSRLDVTTTLKELTEHAVVTNADALEAIDMLCRKLYSELQTRGYQTSAIDEVLQHFFGKINTNDSTVLPTLDKLRQVLGFACNQLVPNLARASDEINNLLNGLAGGYIPAGPSGSPTRGMANILPTGRNFYSVDPRSVPSQSAWRVGQQLAHEVLTRHLRETGDYPQSVAISIWGTSAMRTHGDDVAQILALLGVKPTWRPENRQLCGVEVISLEQLKRPRIDVTTRISGFFRDAFPQLIDLIDDAVHAVMVLDEPLSQNFVRKHYLDELGAWIAKGLSQDQAEQHAGYRIFGAKPGSYGAGILPLIQEKNWQADADFAEAYINWGGYAYARNTQGIKQHDTFRMRLSGIQVALHNQDNREHDIFDSDDYLQFHGGMIATIRALTGQQPRHYFGDSHDPERVRVSDLKEETLRVFRSRVVNPKWLASIQKHGYKGGLELTATVDYLFGYDATAQIMDDWMYEQIANSYAFDPEMQRFLQEANPWAQNAIAERLLEAASRGMWKQPQQESLNGLQDLYLQSETLLEERGETPRHA